MKRHLVKFSGKTYKFISNPFSIAIVVLLILLWFIIGGYYLHFNEQWFFILEATIISFTLFMTFVIEHTQNTNTKALHEKIDELLKKNPKANNQKVGIEKRYKGEK